MATYLTLYLDDQPGKLAREVAVVAVADDRPGVLSDVSRKPGESGVNITLAYVATGTRLAFADDLAAANAALD